MKIINALYKCLSLFIIRSLQNIVLAGGDEWWMKNIFIFNQQFSLFQGNLNKYKKYNFNIFYPSFKDIFVVIT